MTSLELIKDKLISHILLTKNEALLEAVDAIFKSTLADDKLVLSSEQIEMLTMSNREIETGKGISEEDVLKSDAEWMD